MSGEPEFGGVIGRDWRESEPWWPPERDRRGAPNVVLVVLDDVGFAQLGCYGSDIDTPNIDRLAAGGLRYANFHTTALCSPTRSCLLTGRNHHSNGMGRITDLASGYPGYCGRIPRGNGFLSEILARPRLRHRRRRQVAPHARGRDAPARRRERVAARPRLRALLRLPRRRDPPVRAQARATTTTPSTAADEDDGYHLTEDLADHAIEYLGRPPRRRPDSRSSSTSPPARATRRTTRRPSGSSGTAASSTTAGTRGATRRSPASWRWASSRRAPSFAPARLGAGVGRPARARREGRGAVHGVLRRVPLARRRPDRPRARLHRGDRRARQHDDRARLRQRRELRGRRARLDQRRAPLERDPAGRKELRDRIDELGGPTVHNNYPWGWTMAGNTPFRRWKREVHEGGIADPCIVHWPRRIARGAAIAPQFAHAIDVTPTILELVGSRPRRDRRRRAEPDRRHELRVPPPTTPRRARAAHTQYFEMLGCRGIYHDGWKAVTFKPLGTDVRRRHRPRRAVRGRRVGAVPRRRGSPSARPRGEEPEKLAALVDLWWEEARKYHVLPLDNRPLAALLTRARAGSPSASSTSTARGAPVPENVTVNVRNRDHTHHRDVDIPDGASPKACSSRWAPSSAAGRSTCRRPAPVRAQLWARSGTRSVGRRRRPGPHELGSRSRAAATSAGPGACSSTAPSSARARSPTTPVRYSITGAGLPAAGSRAPDRRRHPRRSGSRHAAPRRRRRGRLGHRRPATSSRRSWRSSNAWQDSRQPPISRSGRSAPPGSGRSAHRRRRRGRWRRW